MECTPDQPHPPAEGGCPTYTTTPPPPTSRWAAAATLLRLCPWPRTSITCSLAFIVGCFPPHASQSRCTCACPPRRMHNRLMPLARSVWANGDLREARHFEQGMEEAAAPQQGHNGKPFTSDATSLTRGQWWVKLITALGGSFTPVLIVSGRRRRMASITHRPCSSEVPASTSLLLALMQW